MTKRDIYQEVTDKIIKVLDRVGPGDWQAPFAGLAAQGLPINPTTPHRYQGINIPCLWFDQQEQQFTSNQWATFKQWKQKGAHVRKGEKGSPIIFYKTLSKTGENEQGEAQEISIPMLKTYTVFNADQVEGYKDTEAVPLNETDLVTRIEAVERFCKATGAEIRRSGEGAYYNPVGDFIGMPDSIAFIDTPTASATENYYATLLHELTHWSGAAHRLDRDKAKSRKEIDKYAFEELIAELGAAFLCARLGVTQTPREDHAHYLKNWLQALQNDKKLIFKAAAEAAKASEFLNSMQEGAQ